MEANTLRVVFPGPDSAAEPRTVIDRMLRQRGGAPGSRAPVPPILRRCADDRSIAATCSTGGVPSSGSVVSRRGLPPRAPARPEPAWVMAVSAVAPAANGACLLLITRHRGGGARMKASWIFSTHDVLANLGVIAVDRADRRR